MEPYYNRNGSNRNFSNQYSNNEYLYKGKSCSNQYRRRSYDDSHGRHFEVECVCKPTSVEHCYKEDEMGKLSEIFPIAMAYVRWQQWGELYTPECALCEGTIFKDLNKIFCGERY